MFAKSVARTMAKSARNFTTTSAVQSKVAVLGAAGGIGQPLSLLLHGGPYVSELNCFDLAPVTPGVAADLSHINQPTKVKGFCGNEQLGEALTGCDVVVIPAGVPRKPGMTRDDLFNTNASIVASLTAACGEHCPDAAILIISNPVNSTVPIAAKTLQKMGVYNPKKLFGVTTLDHTRARTFVAESQGWDPRSTRVNVIGGHAGITILPLLSQIEGGVKLTEDEIAAMTHRIQFGGDEVVQAKAGGGSATLSMAAAGAEMTFQVLKALNGEEGIVECTFVESSVTEAKYFATPTKIGKDGVEEVLPVGPMSAFEQDMFDKMMPDLLTQIAKGEKFVDEN